MRIADMSIQHSAFSSCKARYREGLSAALVKFSPQLFPGFGVLYYGAS